MQIGADREGVVGIDCGVAFFDVLDDAVFVDDDVGTLRPLVGFGLHVISLEVAIGAEHLFIHVAEQRKLDIDLLGEGGVGCGGIHADAENFRIRGVDFAAVDSRLDRLELFGSTTCEGEHIDGEKDIFLAAKIAEFDCFPLIAEQAEVRRGVADFERDFGDLISFLRRRSVESPKRQGGKQ